MISPSRELMAFKLTFGDFKQSYNARPLSVVLSRQPNCPVASLSKYLTLWGSRPGAIFLSEDGRYRGHSFGLGAAWYAADRRCSDTQIRMLGRWRSNAFLRNIRVSSLSSWTNNGGRHIYWQRGSVGIGGCPTLLFLTLLISLPRIQLANNNSYHLVSLGVAAAIEFLSIPDLVCMGSFFRS